MSAKSHVARDAPQETPSPGRSRAMVLCAGLGTRLLPLTRHVPKPLVPVGDRSVLNHVCDRLSRAGLDSVVLNAHHLHRQIVEAASRLPLPARVAVEPKILGTAGGVANVRHWLDSPVVVWNGDILADPPIEEMLEAVGDGGVCLAVSPRPVGEGTVGLDGAGNVVRLRGETFGAEAHGGDYVGVAALGSTALSELVEEGCLIGDHCLPTLRAGGHVSTRVCSGKWSDSGNLNSYLKANFDWLEEQGYDAYVARDARVDGTVELSRSVVGAGARVVGAGCVSGCVVWPGAVLQAPARHVIAAHAGIVVQCESGPLVAAGDDS